MNEFPVVVKRALHTILDELDLCDAAGANPVSLAAELKDKVDATVWYLEKLDHEIERIKEWEDIIKRKKAKVMAKRERRIAYVKAEFLRREMKTLKGNMRSLTVAENPAAMQIFEPANAETFVKYPGLVKVEARYEWNRPAVKQFLQEAGGNCSFAGETRGTQLRYKAPKRKS